MTPDETSRLTRTDRYAFARAFVGLDTTGLTPSPLAQMLLAQIDWNSANGLALARQLLAPELPAIFAEDPNAPPPKPARPAYDDLLQIPPLPPAAQPNSDQVEASRHVGVWLQDYMAWATKRCQMTPRVFLQSGGLYAVSLAIARRAVLRLDFDAIYPHLYILWVAPTSYFRKSTGLKAVSQLVRETIPHLLLAAQSTPEMLLFKLAGHQTPNYDSLPPYQKSIEDQGRKFAGQRGIISDEVTKLLFSSKKYMEGQAEAFMELYDAGESMERELRSEGKLIVWEPAVSILGATTPARMARTVGDGDWEDGNLARMALLTPTEKEVSRRLTSVADANFNPPASLKKRLRAIYDALPEPPGIGLMADDSKPPQLEAVSLMVAPGVMDAFNAYADALHAMTAPSNSLDERLKGNYSRLPVLAVKIAIDLVIMDWVDAGCPGAPTISLPHWWQAQLLTEEYRSSAHRLMAALSKSEDIQIEEKVLNYISYYNDRQPTEREIHHGTRIRYRRDVQSALAALIDAGMVVEVERRGTRGPATKGYMVVD